MRFQLIHISNQIYGQQRHNIIREIVVDMIIAPNCICAVKSITIVHYHCL